MEKISKEKAKEMFIQIIEEMGKEEDEIIAKAKEEGRWLPGLDSNNHLFKDVKKKYWKKVEELAKKVEK